MGFKAEVIADGSGKWSGNSLVFGTREQANAYVADLKLRWTLVTETRVVPTDEPPNAVFDRGQTSRYLGPYDATSQPFRT